jgi:hypothetical protein
MTVKESQSLVGLSWMKWPALVAVVAFVFILAMPDEGQAQMRVESSWDAPWGASDSTPPLTRVAPSSRLVGAGVGLIIGAGATYIVLHQGGSTSWCDRSKNQDAMDAGVCAGIVVLGGVIGAGIGALISGALTSEQRQVEWPQGIILQAMPGHPTRIGLRLRM